MAQIGAGCWACGNCGCQSSGCPEGAVSDDPEATCTAEQLETCQTNAMCFTDPGSCRAFEDVPCAGAFGIRDMLPFLSMGDDGTATPDDPSDDRQIAPEFATSQNICNSPPALACVDPEGGCHGCRNCAVNATGNFDCPDEICGNHCQACVPMIGCLNCAAPGDASRD